MWTLIWTLSVPISISRVQTLTSSVVCVVGEVRVGSVPLVRLISVVVTLVTEVMPATYTSELLMKLVKELKVVLRQSQGLLAVAMWSLVVVK